MMHGWGLGGGGGFPGHHQRARFEETYHCYSVAFADKAHLEVSLSCDHVPQLRLSMEFLGEKLRLTHSIYY